MSALLELAPKAETCLVLELKNILSRPTKAIKQANRARQYLGNAAECEPRRGVAFAYRRSRYLERAEKLPEGLDLAVFIASYEQNAAIETLERLEDSAPRRKIKIYSRQLLKHVKDGIALERLLYPRTKEWEEFKKAHPHILPHADTHLRYMRGLSELKGELVPTYVSTVVQKNAPAVGIFTTHQYHDGKKSGDIDMALLGEAEKIYRVLLDEDYFTPVIETEEVRKASGRLKAA